MKRILLYTVIISAFGLTGKTQSSDYAFDTTQFNTQLELADWLVDYESYSQLALNEIAKQSQDTISVWFSYTETGYWHTIGGNFNKNNFRIDRHLTIDSLDRFSDFAGINDTAKINPLGLALLNAETQFQMVRDTCNIYFNSFLHLNSDQSISVWYLPAFQPSGQGIYGCEWEYVFNKTGRFLLKQKSNITTVSGVWIGQPRELWLNYRKIACPTVGSIFFILSFRDYFTRLHIDTQMSTSTSVKKPDGNYTWTHKMKKY